jgi:hypothetical protein
MTVLSFRVRVGVTHSVLPGSNVVSS